MSQSPPITVAGVCLLPLLPNLCEQLSLFNLGNREGRISTVLSFACISTVAVARDGNMKTRVVLNFISRQAATLPPTESVASHKSGLFSLCFDTMTLLHVLSIHTFSFTHPLIPSYVSSFFFKLI